MVIQGTVTKDAYNNFIKTNSSKLNQITTIRIEKDAKVDVSLEAFKETKYVILKHKPKNWRPEANRIWLPIDPTETRMLDMSHLPVREQVELSSYPSYLDDWQCTGVKFSPAGEKKYHKKDPYEFRGSDLGATTTQGD